MITLLAHSLGSCDEFIGYVIILKQDYVSRLVNIIMAIVIIKYRQVALTIQDKLANFLIIKLC